MTNNEDEKIHTALSWIVEILNRHNVPYQIVGGLAAQAYGARRPLVDIDLYVPLEAATGLLEEIRPYITREPIPHLSASWDLIYLALNYQGQDIEIGDSSTNPRFFNRRDGRWEQQIIDYSRSQVMRLYGVEVNVMPQDELVSYKAMLEREVDHIDLAQIAEKGEH